MNNEDKVRKAIELIKGSSIALACDEVIALLKETLPPEQQLYFNQPVLVSNDGKVWRERYFSHRKGSVFACFCDAYSSRATKETITWKYCKPDLKAESLPNWIDHDGEECPVDPITPNVNVIYDDGSIISGKAGNRLWSSVVKYAVIPLPKH